MTAGNASPPSLPGQKLEEAAANVASEAGRSLIRGLAKLSDAKFATWIEKRHAQAAAARLAVETKAKVDADQILDTARRHRETSELEHRATLRRRLTRLEREFEREQENLEAIEWRAIQLAESSDSAQRAREIDEDWMFMFARHAQDVSDSDVQEWWARILAAASMTVTPRLSPAGIQTMTLIDKQLATGFERACAAIESFGYLPTHDRGYDVEKETQGIDLLALKEIGLLAEDPISGSYDCGSFTMEVGPVPGKRMGLLHTSFSLTRRGQEIAAAVFAQTSPDLSPELRNQYLRDIVQTQMEQYVSMTITPKPKPNEIICPFSIVLSHSRGDKPLRGDFTVIEDRFDDSWRNLLEWAASRFDTRSSSGLPPAPRHYPTFG